MRIHHIAIATSALLLIAGCGPRQSATPQATARANENQWFWDEVAKATQLESNADVVLTVDGARVEHAVRLVGPLQVVTNDLVRISDFHTALASVQHRELAVIEMYAFGFDTNRLTNAAAQLRQCGFQDVRAIVLRWGGKFVGPPL